MIKVLTSLLLSSSIFAQAALVTLVQVSPPASTGPTPTHTNPFSQITKIYTPIGTAQDGHETTYSFTEVVQFVGGGSGISMAGSQTISSAWTSTETFSQSGIRIEGPSGYILSRSQDDSHNQLSQYLTCSYSGTSGGCREDVEVVDAAGFAANIPGFSTAAASTRTTTLTTSWTGNVVPLAMLTVSGGSGSPSNNGVGSARYNEMVVVGTTAIVMVSCWILV
ncbi:hypothetical protein DL96DRAFT_1821393 [Flagelloscypha sp. PMI_526]|nr:hypothetical protein DL96DRAFT_1821393 [Flagelloscypha sp. PMI_526]